MVRRFPLLSVSLLLFAAGCANAGGPAGSPGAASPEPEAAFDARAERIAQAWRDSPAKDAWRTGFVPLEPLTLAPKGARLTEALKHAFTSGWYRLEAGMPREIGDRVAVIRYPDGSRTSVRLVALAEAYDHIDQGDPPPCPGPTVPPPADAPGADAGDGTSAGQPDRAVSAAPPRSCAALTVTGARLGDVTMLTSRGQAKVPAWLFTVRELAAPIARVAVEPSAITAPPTINAGQPPSGAELRGALHLTGVDGSRLSYGLGVGACDEDITPLAYETDEVVVVGGTATTRRDGACPDILKIEQVRVELKAPPGLRPVIDGLNGQVLAVTPAE